MKKALFRLTLTVLTLGLVTAQAQFGPPGRGSGPQFGGAIRKLFGDNQAFSASLQFQITPPESEDAITLPGKLCFNDGKSRFEMNLADIQGSKMPPNAAAQMKAMGMDQMVAIGRPDKDVSYLIYPGLQSYVENHLPAATSTNSNFKVETTELGKETVDGHDCIKNQVVVTGSDGVKHESTVWDATDLKKFPIKIQTNEEGRQVVMLFKDVSLAKPDASEFEPPSGYTKYDDMRTMMQTEMMKKMGGGMGTPPNH